MGLFDKKIKVFEMKGRRSDWKAVKDALKEAGMAGVSASTWTDEMPVGGCGARLDVRDFGPNGKIDRQIYTIRVRGEDAERAAEIVRKIVPDYQPYEKKNRG